MGNFVDELYYKQCNHEESDINKSPLLMSKSTSDMYHEEYDRMRQRFRIQISNFNPRTHEGYDKWAGKVDESTKISIHVPTKGTTVLSNNAADFNEFQSTYPRRVRQIYCNHDDALLYFNPRTHEGYDATLRNRWLCQRTFQSTYPRRVRLDVQQEINKKIDISIHVPTKGTTAKIYNNIPSFLLIFIYFPIFSYQNIKSTLFKNNYWYFFQCESLCIFLSASYSHLQNTQVQHLSAFLYELWQTSQLLH